MKTKVRKRTAVINGTRFTAIKDGVLIETPHGTIRRMNSWYTDTDIFNLTNMENFKKLGEDQSSISTVSTDGTTSQIDSSSQNGIEYLTKAKEELLTELIKIRDTVLFQDWPKTKQRAETLIAKYSKE